jgi:hypothetical protein
VEPTDYVYRGGLEAGVRVGLINYPRFPQDADSLFQISLLLAEHLMKGLHQHSFSIQTPETTYWYSRRPEDQK